MQHYNTAETKPIFGLVASAEMKKKENKNTMNQKELTQAIAKRFFLTQVESREVIKFILSRITEDLKKGERAYFRGFGSFAKEKRSSKKVRHPKTGKIITIPERITVDFDPSQELIENLR